MRTGNRKSAPEVSGGKVKKKNNWDLSPNYYDTPQVMPVIDRKRPGKGYRHILKQEDIHNFISLLPDWDELSQDLNAVVLAPGHLTYFGYHTPGVVHICAWNADLWLRYRQNEDHLEKMLPTFRRLGIPCELSEDGYHVDCQFNESTVRAFQLLDVLLHELGHHHDRITTKSQKRASRGEAYAEAYALAYEAKIWDEYQRRFGLG